jgi:hypothetical protein
MLRTIIRVFAILGLFGSVVIGGIATYIYLTPSDEQKLYEQKVQEVEEKFRKWEAAKGTPAEARLGKEFKDASDSAATWGRGYREGLRWNRLGVLASSCAAFLCFTILMLTFIKRKNKIAIPHADTRHNPNPNYGGQSGFENHPPRRY